MPDKPQASSAANSATPSAFLTPDTPHPEAPPSPAVAADAVSQRPDSSSVARQTEPPSPGPEGVEMSEAPTALPESPKAAAEGALAAAREIMVGSTHFGEELKGAGKDALAVPVGLYATPLRAIRQLIGLHPLESMRALRDGFTGTLGRIIHVVTAPSRLTVAGAAGVGRGVAGAGMTMGGAAKAVALSPLHAVQFLDRKASNFLAWLEKKAGGGSSMPAAMPQSA